MNSSAVSKLISCIMPTAGRRRFVPQAIRCFLAQDYAEKELLIVDDGADPVPDLVPNDPRIRYFRPETRQRLGAKRNFACERAGGDLIVHWDDDDWSAPWRLRYQAAELLAARADISGLDRLLFYAPHDRHAWEYVVAPGSRPWVYGASLCYTKAFWQARRFPDIDVGEDSRFVWDGAPARIHALADPRFLVSLVHPGNTSRKLTSAAPYRAARVEEIERLLGADLSFYLDLARPAPAPEPAAPAPGSTTRGNLLISAALGIGDILRVTPLVRVAHSLGYGVDLLLVTDYPEVVALLEGAPEVRRVFHLPSERRRKGPAHIEGLDACEYDVATFTMWSAKLRDRIRARRVLAFDRQSWDAEGDSRSVERLARELGWRHEMPAPFAMPSTRRFDLPPGTVAIHPGCKAEWPWKKWHGFADLAQLFQSVVIAGSEEDLRLEGAYFQQTFAWPRHARDFIGRLSLPDTAALLSQCAALVSNDSGLMHLGAALGVPTFGIFGITSARREAIPVPNFHPITKGLECEAACHAGQWGRRDCERHIECLKTLTPGEVFKKVTEIVPSTAPPETPISPAPLVVADETVAAGDHNSAETIDLLYYGNLFDASGYGQAARAYIHALHSAGVNVAAVDIAGHPGQVADPLVESLTRRRLDADFHLFHGIPPYWSRLAFPLRNVIAMTVWETDMMPPQWRPVLNHALEVWLPCEFNTTVFARALQRPVFKLPHPIFPPPSDPSGAYALSPDLDLDRESFVFYSIFEWQERKGPVETIEAFLGAFPTGGPAVLVLKINPGAAQAAATALAGARTRVPSTAQVLLRCEAWSEAQVAALHARGDAYLSLHRGEGWNLPLFTACCLGKPVIATGFSGPLDYLDPAAHCLVRSRPAPVRQRYAFYMPSMNWADPDAAHAAELMRQVFEDRAGMARRSAAHAARLRSQFSLEAIGAAARARLLQLLRKTNPEKLERLQSVDRATRLKPSVPIPGDWYDADYFENGLKSNWTEGYTWAAFGGLFRETADFLSNTFPESRSFLDAGCGKGFLVRALRDLGLEASGFDHSPWAIGHAEKSALPFIKLAGVCDAAFDCDYDVLLVMALLESLTEQQALAFLDRVRARIRHALVANIFTCEEEKSSHSPSHDRDLSHITLRSRSWWHELFLRAGWRQDALHRLVQRNCQRHPLPSKMAWSIFVYSPLGPEPV